MSERPIIFDGESVRSILANEKTQTRRVLNLRGRLIAMRWSPFEGGLSVSVKRGRDIQHCLIEEAMDALPYQVGDTLWVKETWCEYDGDDCRYEYRADNPDPLSLKWRSPLFMPRVASRLSLLVTDVRVQRLHDISEEDAVAEGISADLKNVAPIAYAARWDTINAKRGFPWSNNDWVVATTFARKAA